MGKSTEGKMMQSILSQQLQSNCQNNFRRYSFNNKLHIISNILISNYLLLLSEPMMRQFWVLVILTIEDLSFLQDSKNNRVLEKGFGG